MEDPEAGPVELVFVPVSEIRIGYTETPLKPH